MILTTRRMFADVSVITIALLPVVAVMSASVGNSGWSSFLSFAASTLRIGTTWVISSSVGSIASGSSPNRTGMLPFFALSRDMIRKTRPSWIAVKPLFFSAAASSVTASCAVTGVLLVRVTRPSTGPSFITTKPAELARWSRTASSEASLKLTVIFSEGLVEGCVPAGCVPGCVPAGWVPDGCVPADCVPAGRVPATCVAEACVAAGWLAAD